MNNKIINIITLFFISFTNLLGLKAQLSEPLPFMTKFEPKSATIVNYSKLQKLNENSALVRLPNNKISLMVRNKGTLEPFYIKAIETGYWDTRYETDTNYDTVFADMRDMGANTAYVMIHWEEIETSDNHFDYSFADNIVAAASRQDLKLKWILFLHAQKNGVPSHSCENSWTFHLDDRDSCNYTMQWPKQKGKVYKDIKTLVDNGGIRPLHVYGHPEIFYRIRRMLYNLAVHYRHSETVIGVQLGNEEGFSFLDESDFNPVTASLYEEWKIKTNKTDYAQFKKEAINWWWKQFTSAYHEGDPYKILSFNLDAGQSEAEDPERTAVSGTSSATYNDGNLDAIGTMFYKNWGNKAWLGLDKYYNEGRYNYELPILIPSEIGIGRFNSPHNFNNFVVNSLERGAQGFGVYCYGEVRKELPDSISARKYLTDMFSSIVKNESIIYAGLPGPGYVCGNIVESPLKVSHLNVDNKETLIMIYNPNDNMEPITPKNEDLSLRLNSNENGKYKVNVCKNGATILTKTINLDKDKENLLLIPEVSVDDIIFISVTK